MTSTTEHPERDEHPTAQPRSGAPRWTIALGVVAVAALLTLMIALHLSGAIGPGVH